MTSSLSGSYRRYKQEPSKSKKVNAINNRTATLMMWLTGKIHKLRANEMTRFSQLRKDLALLLQTLHA